jgi:hypothetical protein
MIVLSLEAIWSISIIMDAKSKQIISVTQDLNHNLGHIFRILLYFLLIFTPFSNPTTSLSHLLPSIAKSPQHKPSEPQH